MAISHLYIGVFFMWLISGKGLVLLKPIFYFCRYTDSK